MTKVDTPDPVTPGGNFNYTITVTNAGPSNAANVSLSDTLPAGTTFVSLVLAGRLVVHRLRRSVRAPSSPARTPVSRPWAAPSSP